MPSAWIDHVKSVQAKKGISYKDALTVASKSYKKGGMMRLKPDGSGTEEIPESKISKLPSDVLSKITEFNTGRETLKTSTPNRFADLQRYTKVGDNVYEVEELQKVIKEPIKTQFRYLYSRFKKEHDFADVDSAFKEEKQLYKALGKPVPPNHKEEIRKYFYERDNKRGFL